MTTASGRQLSRLLNRLAATRPESRVAGKLRMEAELALLRMVKSGGKRVTDSAIKTIRVGGQRLSRDANITAASQFYVTLDDADSTTESRKPRAESRIIEVWFNAGQVMQATNVRYAVAAPPKPAGTPAQRARHELQEAFYKRYTDVGQRWYRGRGPRRLPKADNVILLIGELEADVNNGGFSQYLDNKGRRRALSALAALKNVGAHTMADMLKAAMSPSVSEKQRNALDARFYKVPEDLPVMTMRWVREGLTRRG